MRYAVYKCACFCIKVSRCLCLVSMSLVSLSGMALGFFNLGPRTHMSGQIGVPSIFMRKSDWQITVILLTSLHCLFFCCLKTSTLDNTITAISAVTLCD